MSIWIWIILILVGVGTFLWYRTKQFKATIEHMHQLVEESKGEKASEIALELVEVGELQDARKVLVRGAQLGNISAANHLGMLITAAREANKSTEDDDHAERTVLSLAPKMGAMYFVGANKHDEAVNLLKSAVARGDEEAGRSLGDLLIGLGREEEGVAALEECLKKGFVPAALDLANYYDDKGQLDKALEQYQYLRDQGAEGVDVSLDDVIRNLEREIAAVAMSTTNA